MYASAQDAEYEVRSSVEEAVRAEVVAAADQRVPSRSVSSYVETQPLALRNRDTTYGIPDFVPIGGVAWPEPLLHLWRSMRYSSLVGIFPDLSRVWLTIDNQLILWDYRSGREFCLYDEVPELIVAVGVPVRARPDVFQPHITYVLPVATASMVVLIGICLIHGDGQSEIKMVSLGYSVASDTILTKITGVAQTGRIFCSGADGNVYELQYGKDKLGWQPRMRLVCFAYPFASKPVLGQVGAMVRSAIKTWTGPDPGLRDLVVDDRYQFILALDEKSTLHMWSMEENGLSLRSSLPHKPQQFMSARHAVGELSPLVRLFVRDPDHEGCTITAIADNGDQFRYRYQSAYFGGSFSGLELRLRIPSYFDPDQVVGVCTAADSTVVMAHYSRAEEEEAGGSNNNNNNKTTAADMLTVATSPLCIPEPHHGCRDVVSTYTSQSSQMVRVDAMEKIPPHPRQSINDVCAQVCFDPSKYLIAHRHGLAVFVRLRPVDSLHLILACADAHVRDGLLHRFSAVHSPADYVAMLLQIAMGALYASGEPLHPCLHANMPNPTSVEPPTSTTGWTMEYLGRVVSAGPTASARHLARTMLRSTATPTTQSDTAPSGSKQLTVVFSPFANGLTAYLGRALAAVWELAAIKVATEDYARVEGILAKLMVFLEGMEIPTQGHVLPPLEVAHQFQRSRVVVSLPPGATFSANDAMRLQLVYLAQCFNLVRRAWQCMLLMRQSSFIPFAAEDANLTVGQLLVDQSAAFRVGRHLCQVVSSAQQGVGAASGERMQGFHALMRQCPYFFANVDAQAFEARVEMDGMAAGSTIESSSDAKLREWASTVAPNAANYWSSGALQNMCQKLTGLKKEELAVELLLRAASQIDPNHAAFTLYLAERNPNISTNASSSSSSGSSSATIAAALQTKRQILNVVIAILEGAWLSHRSAVDSLLGGPRTSGTMWEMEPQDELAHSILLDWLAAPREDAALTETLRNTLVAARSPFLETYLRRHAATLGEEYAHFLRRSQRNPKAAIEQSLLLAQSALHNIPSAERLAYRVRLLSEALECCREGNSDQQQLVEQRLSLMQAQQRLLALVSSFVSSGLPHLEQRWHVDGQYVSERELALQHVELLSQYVATASDLLRVAGMYPAFGGAEVQLDVLVASNVKEAATYASCIVSAYELRGETVEDITRRLVLRYYKPTVAFPISCVVRMLEAELYATNPSGSRDAVKIFTSCDVDAKVLFGAYTHILDNTDGLDNICTTFAQSGITTAYLIHSLAVVVNMMASACRRGVVQRVVVRSAVNIVQQYVRQVPGGAAEAEREAVEKAESLIRATDLSLTW